VLASLRAPGARPTPAGPDVGAPTAALVDFSRNQQRKRTDEVRMRNCLTLFLLLGLLSNSIGCRPGGGMALVAAPPPPAAVLPRGLDPLASPPTAGLTRIVLDADGKRATVTEVLGWSDSQATAVGSSEWVAEHGERAPNLHHTVRV
jgi:hypothetical protein